MKEIFDKIRREFAEYSKGERLFVLAMMLSSFFVSMEAAITRNAAQSIYTHIFGSPHFPYVWIASVPLNLFLVAFYNYFIPRIGPYRIMVITVAVGLIINTFCAFLLPAVRPLAFFLYLWKDIFIILMFQQLWSVIHSTIKIGKAKYLYGIFFGMGGIGSVFGSLVPGFLAVRLGTEKLLLLTLPLYVVIVFMYKWSLAAREKIHLAQDIQTIDSDATDIMGGLQLIKKSPFLKFILLIVLIMQVSCTLLDFQFNVHVAAKLPDQDMRTEFFGRFFGVVNTVNILLQFVGAWLLVHLGGLQRAHTFVPLVLFCETILYLFFGGFPFMALTYRSEERRVGKEC